MSRVLLVLSLAASLVSQEDVVAAASTQLPLLSLEDTTRLRRALDPQISPDGSRVAFVISEPDLDENRYNTDVWLVPVDDGEPVRLTTGPGSDRSPRWSPDGTKIAFVSNRDGKNQIWLIRPDGGEAWQISDTETGVQSFSWSPDGGRIAFIALGPESPEEVERKRLLGGTVLFGRDFRLSQIFVLDVASGRIDQVTRGDSTVTALSWSPKDDQIAFSAQPTPVIPDVYLSDIYVVSLTSGEVRDLVVRNGIDWQPKWSPDGKTIAFASADGTDDWIANNYICTVPAAGGTPSNIGRRHDGLVTRFEWAADSRTLLYLANERVRRQLFELRAVDGAIERLSDGNQGIASFSRSADGTRLALLAQDPDLSWEIHASPADSFGPRRLTDTNPFLRERALGQLEVMRWESRDGTEIEGLLIKPVGYERGRQYPLLTYVHGGPASLFIRSSFPAVGGSQSVQASPYPVQVLAGQGYAVFFPNPRGSNGYGEAFRMAVVKEWGYADLDDIQSGIDSLIEAGIADPERLGIMGWSYGGFMTAWATTQTNRFKAASVGAGFTNVLSFYGQTDIPGYVERYIGDVPWGDMAEYARHSTMFHVGSITTPTLIQHGERDPRVPLAQAHELYQALSRRGIPVEFAIYPRQGHSVTEPKLQIDMRRRNLDWFNRWLPPDPAR